MSKIRVGITGSRTYENKNNIKLFIFKLKEQTADEVIVVGMGDKDGTDRYVKKYALELGYSYEEMNLAHTPKNLYSLMAESYYNKPYQNKNLFQRNKIYCQYIAKCVIFDNTNQQDKKISNLINQLTKLNKKAVLITT